MEKAYQKLLESKQLNFDAAQSNAVTALAELSMQLEHIQAYATKKIQPCKLFSS